MGRHPVSSNLYKVMAEDIKRDAVILQSVGSLFPSTTTLTCRSFICNRGSVAIYMYNMVGDKQKKKY